MSDKQDWKRWRKTPFGKQKAQLEIELILGETCGMPAIMATEANFPLLDSNDIDSETRERIIGNIRRCIHKFEARSIQFGKEHFFDLWNFGTGNELDFLLFQLFEDESKRRKEVMELIQGIGKFGSYKTSHHKPW